MNEEIFHIRYDESSTIAYYQMDILRSRNDGRFTGLIAGTDSNGINISFITNMLPNAEEYYSSHHLTRKEAIYLIEKIIDNARWCINNLLDPACIMTQPKFIYFEDTEDFHYENKIVMVYLPLRDPGSNIKTAKLSDDFISLLDFSSVSVLFDADESSRIKNMDLYDPDDCMSIMTSLSESKDLSPSPVKVRSGGTVKLSFSAFPFFILSQLFLIYAGYHLLKHIDKFDSPLPATVAVILILLIIAVTDLYVIFSRSSPIKRFAREFFNAKSIAQKSISAEINEDRTVLIDASDGNSRTAMLCAGIPGTAEEAKTHKGFILSDDFLIGRDPSKVDFRIENSSVGRIHARITRRQNVFYIEDLGSYNGTYIDGRRIKKGTDNMLPDKCKICFADIEYYFVAS